MSKLEGYALTDQQRIKALTTKFIQAQLEKGEIPFTEDAIKEALPKAFSDATGIVNAVNNYAGV